MNCHSDFLESEKFDYHFCHYLLHTKSCMRAPFQQFLWKLLVTVYFLGATARGNVMLLGIVTYDARSLASSGKDPFALATN